MNNKSRAVVYMLFSALCFGFMAAMVKLAGDIPVFEKVFFRNLISLFVAFGAIKRSSESMFGKRENQKYLIARALLGLIGVFLYFYSINNLYLADSAMLNKLSPFFVTFFAVIFLNEKLTPMKIISMIVVFLGALLVIKPQWNLSIIPSIAGFLSAAFAGAAYTLVRFLKDRENPSIIVFYFSFVSVIGTLPFMLVNFVMPTGAQFMYLILTGIFAAIAQFALTYSYKYAPASEVAIYNYTNIIFSAVIGFFVWNEVPDMLSIVGGCIIVIMAIIVYLQGRKVAVS
ncbi:DMT family transporter [Clostridium ganghwense]|uniref:DMT family transporter n=1 Tax=Clostridium ganghwense TaxID=312089 RepID=A0ABT4CLS8_9CLOT|nr:DMT family transporter [Clostridium ganghwense]MCY6370005.1 DMT family transporter [Clostridium ganghwense]